MDSFKKIIEIMIEDANLSVQNTINKSGILSDFPSEELPTLINSVNFMKNNVSGVLLNKIKGVLENE